jgi:hypothetical protein
MHVLPQARFVGDALPENGNAILDSKKSYK